MTRIVSTLAIIVALAACREAPPAPAAGDAQSAAASPAPSTGATAAARTESSVDAARQIDEETDLFFFEYAWPGAAGRIPALAAELERRADEARSTLERDARTAREEAEEGGYDFRKHSFGLDWKKVTDLPDYLSLSGGFYTYSGGAHGNSGMQSLVWDKNAGQALDGIDLFISPEALEQALGNRTCTALNAARRAKLGQVPENATCPHVDEFTVLVGSSNGAYFDRLTLYAGPYVAGAYAEGAYEVDLAIDGRTRAAVKPQYRPAFAPPSQ